MPKSADSRVALYAMIGVTLIGFGLRYYNWDADSYWSDELWSAACSNPAHSFAELMAQMRQETNPHLYQVFLWLCYKLFGYGPFTGRFISILAGAAAIPAIYFLAQKVADSRAALAAALFTALNPMFLQYSQEARSYALLTLLTIVSTHTLLLIFDQRKSGKGVYAGYGILALATLNIHFYGYLVVFFQALYALWVCLRSRALLGRCFLLFLLIFLVNIPFMYRMLALASGTGQFWIAVPSPGIFADCFIEFFRTPYLALFMLALVLLGVFLGKNATVTALLLLSFLSVFVLPVVVSQFLPYGLVQARYVMPLLPFILITAGLGLAAIRGKTTVILLAALFCLASFAVHERIGPYTRTLKEDYRGLILQVAEERNDEAVYGMWYFNVLCEWYKLGFSVDSDSGRIAELPPGSRFWLVNPAVFPKPSPREFGAEAIRELSANLVWGVLYEKK